MLSMILRRLVLVVVSWKESTTHCKVVYTNDRCLTHFHFGVKFLDVHRAPGNNDVVKNV